MEIKTILLDEQAIARALRRISHEIIENNKGVENVVLIGIARGGVPVSNILYENIKKIENVSLPIGKLDITLYRDDIETKGIQAQVTDTHIPFSIKDKDIILCDDVLYTGRTVRAGIDALISLGRPRSIQLAVLIDRGHRELPIRADYVGKNVPTSKEEKVDVIFGDNGESKAVIRA
jgi:pyrimidine operon attenuation protein/uracil phosphoribosyltransferase